MKLSEIRDLIQINFKEAIYQADQLEKIAAKLKTKRDSLDEIRQETANAWTGELSQAYQQKIFLTEEEMQKTAADLQRAAGTIRTVAEKVKNTELRAIELGEQRTY